MKPTTERISETPWARANRLTREAVAGFVHREDAPREELVEKLREIWGHVDVTEKRDGRWIVVVSTIAADALRVEISAPGAERRVTVIDTSTPSLHGPPDKWKPWKDAVEAFCETQLQLQVETDDIGPTKEWLTHFCARLHGATKDAGTSKVNFSRSRESSHVPLRTTVHVFGPPADGFVDPRGLLLTWNGSGFDVGSFGEGVR